VGHPRRLPQHPGGRWFDTEAESDAFFNRQPSFPVGAAEDQAFYADHVPSTCGERVKRDYFIGGTQRGPDVTCSADDDTPFP